MSHASPNWLAAYGAYRLKATYQRNMLWALTIVTALVVLTVGLASVLLGSTRAASGPVAPPPEPPVSDTIVINLLGETVVIPDDPPPTPRPPNRHPDGGSIPVPVDDGSISDPPPETTPPPDQFGWGDSGVGSGIDAPGMGAVLVFDTAEIIPGPNDFVKVERQPELIYSAPPDYPRWARERGVEGMVVIKALVGRAGDVLDATVFVTSGDKLLDEAALAVAGKYRYRPAVQNGRPVAVWVTYKVHFKLSH